MVAMWKIDTPAPMSRCLLSKLATTGRLDRGGISSGSDLWSALLALEFFPGVEAEALRDLINLSLFLLNCLENGFIRTC